MKRIPLDVDRIVKMYKSGKSINALSKLFDVSRPTITRRLKERNVRLRSQSESEALKWAQMSDEQRAKQVEAAHEAVRNKPDEFFEQAAIKQAQTKQRTLSKVGDLERLFITTFEDRGYDPIPQKAIYVYNTDIAIGSTAIEIHIQPSFPHNHSYYSRRIVDLLKRGWNAIYIKIGADLSVERTANKISAMIDLIQSDESPVSHYGMIRGSSELVSSGCLQGDDLTIVDASDGFFAAVK